MLESDLSPAVCNWLRHRGMTVYCEFPYFERSVDVVGIGPDVIVAVELKLSLSRRVIQQAATNQVFANESWCAVYTKPRSIEWAEREGLGIMRVRDMVCVLVEPREREFRSRVNANRIRQVAEGLEPGGVGGVESQPRPGGPAQAVAKMVAPLYRERVPWDEIYRLVPNHYAHAKSMQSVMLGYGPARAILDAAGGEPRGKVNRTTG